MVEANFSPNLNYLLRFGLTRRLHGQHVGAGIADGRTPPLSFSTGIDGITFLAGR